MHATTMEIESFWKSFSSMGFPYTLLFVFLFFDEYFSVRDRGGRLMDRFTFRVNR